MYNCSRKRPIFFSSPKFFALIYRLIPFNNKSENTDRLLKWSTAIIAFLITIIIGFGGHYVNRLEKSLEALDAAKVAAPEPRK